MEPDERNYEEIWRDGDYPDYFDRSYTKLIVYSFRPVERGGLVNYNRASGASLPVTVRRLARVEGTPSRLLPYQYWYDPEEAEINYQAAGGVLGPARFLVVRSSGVNQPRAARDIYENNAIPILSRAQITRLYDVDWVNSSSTLVGEARRAYETSSSIDRFLPNGLYMYENVYNWLNPTQGGGVYPGDPRHLYRAFVEAKARGDRLIRHHIYSFVKELQYEANRRDFRVRDATGAPARRVTNMTAYEYDPLFDSFQFWPAFGPQDSSVRRRGIYDRRIMRGFMSSLRRRVNLRRSEAAHRSFYHSARGYSRSSAIKRFRTN